MAFDFMTHTKPLWERGGALALPAATTLSAYLKNILEHPQELRYRRIPADGKVFTEYYKDSYLVESFDQPLLSVGTLMSRGFKVDFEKMQMTTKSGHVVPMDSKFDTPAQYLNAAEPQAT